MASGVPITNTLFPPPPGYYKAFTPDAVARYAALRGDNDAAGPSSSTGAAGASDNAAGPSSEPAPAPAEPGEMEELAAAMEPPRADWVLEEGRWMLFGQMYTAEPHIATAKEIGLPALVADPVSGGGDAERQALPVLLHSFLHTLLALVDVLTGTSRVPDELERAGRASQGDQYIQHLSNLAATMMVSANQLRGVQAEATLVMLMEKQLEERRAQTERLRAKSREVAAMVRRLKETSAVEVAKGTKGKATSGAEGGAEGDAKGDAGEIKDGADESSKEGDGESATKASPAPVPSGDGVEASAGQEVGQEAKEAAEDAGDGDVAMTEA